MKHPLDILIYSEHHHGPQTSTKNVRSYLRKHGAVRSFGNTQRLDEAELLISQGLVNTVFLDGGLWSTDVVDFVARQRKYNPGIVIVLLADSEWRTHIVEHYHPRFKHYLWFSPYDIGEGKQALQVDLVMSQCQETLFEHYNYDVAISFSGDEREHARKIAERLRAMGNRVFFDEFLEEDLLGKDLFSYLHNVYARDARYCVMLVSNSYSRRAWTNHERRASQERVPTQAGGEYILPVRIDNTNLPGVFSTLGHISIDRGVEHIAEVVHKKLWAVPEPKNKKLIGSKTPDYY